MKKVKSKQETGIEEEPDIAESLNENPAIQWVVENRTTLAYLFVALVLGILLITRWSNGATAKAGSDFIKAENLFITFQRETLDPDSEKSGEEALTQLQSILDDYPELHPKYDGRIAQTFIAVNDVEKAMPFAISTLDRIKGELPKNYPLFSEITLLISGKNYEEASKLENQITDNQSALYAYHLIRQAMLNQVLENQEEEAESWTTFKTHAKKYISDNSNYKQLLENFEDGKTSLYNYIETRENSLNVANY